MKTIVQTLLALSFVGAAAVSTPTSTQAQGVSIYGPGYEVDIGARRYPPYNYRRGYDAYGYYPSPYYGRQNYGSGIYRGRDGQYYCNRPGFTVQDGVCKPYRGY